MFHFDLFDTDLSRDVWAAKYKHPDDWDISQTFARVAKAIHPDPWEEVYNLMLKGIFMPAGRILAGAGTGRRVTLMNCYVMGDVEDSLDDIMRKLEESALTMQQGGGIGVYFGNLRPKGAILVRTGSYSSGPCTFIDMWDTMCATIMSAGHRRGAMMATFPIWHPDIVDFIEAKSQPNRWRNFNVSVLVPDAFMQAVEKDESWTLHHPKYLSDGSNKDLIMFTDAYTPGHPHESYVYSTVPARKLWEHLMKHTYQYSEPGVIFIDKINNENNLRYRERIWATNPCGEQPLPPYNACNLGAINLAQLVRLPFNGAATMDIDELKHATHMAIRFLDNVIDVTNYPLELQANEQKAVRRVGLGITGLGDAIAMHQLHYGSKMAVDRARSWMQAIATQAYRTSIELAKERGHFPELKLQEHAQRPFMMKILPLLDKHIVDDYWKTGIRNGTLLTVAPTGTTSAFFGNVSSGCEPTFAHRHTRKVRQSDDSYRPYEEYSYLVRRYKFEEGFESLEDAYAAMTVDPNYRVEAGHLTVQEHIVMQAALQEWVDASISKTVNIPAETDFGSFHYVYESAWRKGCKGCTTYRPSEVRGSILEVAPTQTGTQTKEANTANTTNTTTAAGTATKGNGKLSPPLAAQSLMSYKRPAVLSGVTHRINWPGLKSAVYVTVNYDNGLPVEVFISSKNFQHVEWATALSVMISKMLKLTKDPEMIARELSEINISLSSAWEGGKHYGSILARIGDILLEHSPPHEEDEEEEATVVAVSFAGQAVLHASSLDPVLAGDLEPGKAYILTQEIRNSCPACGSLNVKSQSGCLSCNDCGHTKCE